MRLQQNEFNLGTIYVFCLCRDILFLSSKTTVSSSVSNETLFSLQGFASAGQSKQEFIIVRSNATWFQAFQECNAQLAITGNNGGNFRYLRNYLFVHHPEFIGVALWTGFVKPNLDGFWYRREKCSHPLNKNTYNTFANDDISVPQCLLINMTVNTVDDIGHTWYAASCQERHSFICSREIGNMKLKEYKGTQIHSVNLSSYKKEEFNTTTTTCEKKCLNHVRCFCAELNVSSNVCTGFLGSVGALPVELTLQSEQNDTVSYVKNEGHDVNVSQMLDVDFSQTFNETDLPCYRHTISTEILTSVSSPISAHSILDTPSHMDITASTPDIWSTNTGLGSSLLNEKRSAEIADETYVRRSISITHVYASTPEVTDLKDFSNIQTSMSVHMTETISLMADLSISLSSNGILPSLIQTEPSWSLFSSVGFTYPLSSTSDTAGVYTASYNEESSASFQEINIDSIKEKIREENIVEIKTLSSFRNKFQCAVDTRPSSKTIGIFGALFIGIFGALLFFSDVPLIIRHIRIFCFSAKSQRISVPLNIKLKPLFESRSYNDSRALLRRRSI